MYEICLWLLLCVLFITLKGAITKEKEMMIKKGLSNKENKYKTECIFLQ